MELKELQSIKTEDYIGDFTELLTENANSILEGAVIVGTVAKKIIHKGRLAVWISSANCDKYWFAFLALHAVHNKTQAESIANNIESCQVERFNHGIVLY